MIELKSCPFCGAEAHLTFSDHSGTFIQCTNDTGDCGAGLGYHNTDEEAIAAWNKREVISAYAYL